MYITTNGGFEGNLAYLQYFNATLKPERIKKLHDYYLKKINKCIKKYDKPKPDPGPDPEPDPQPSCPCNYV